MSKIEHQISHQESNNPVQEHIAADSPQTFDTYIDDKKKIYNSILQYLEISDADPQNEKHLQAIIDIAKSQKIEEDRNEFQQFLQMINNITSNHYRTPNFHSKVNRLLQNYQEPMKHTFTNIELFNLFDNNKMILLYLFQNEVITISLPIYKGIINRIEHNQNRYSYFFYPEIEKFTGPQPIKAIKNEILERKDPHAFENIEEKRQEGQNDLYVCSLIRQDSVVEFSSYLKKNGYSPNCKLGSSIFETNQFLIEKDEMTMIEYAAFYGSIKIVQYLMENNVEVKPSIWLNAVHSNNLELLHLLEQKKIQPPENSYVKCFFESIKCHHNDIAKYIKTNLLDKSLHLDEEIVSVSIKYSNFYYLQADLVNTYGFFDLTLYNYDNLVNLYLKKNETKIKNKIEISNINKIINGIHLLYVL